MRLGLRGVGRDAEHNRHPEAGPGQMKLVVNHYQRCLLCQDDNLRFAHISQSWTRSRRTIEHPHSQLIALPIAPVAKQNWGSCNCYLNAKVTMLPCFREEMEYEIGW